MPTQAARQAYTEWVLADTRYQQARLDSLENPLSGEAKERKAEQLAALAKKTKDAWDAYLAAMKVDPNTAR